MLRDLENSNSYLKKAQQIDENFIDFKFYKSKYLILKNEVNDAIQVLKEYKKNPKFLITLLILYFNLGENELGKSLLNDYKNIIKDNPEFYNYYGIRQLYEGNFDEGWKYYEYRNSKTVDFFKDTKEWTGEKINSKNIVVFNEQGLGDSIQFSKYIIPLSKIANNVTFVVQNNIKDLFKNDIKNLSIDTIENCTKKNLI